MLLSKNVNQKFESKSQLASKMNIAKEGCYQRTLIKSLKANHNPLQKMVQQMQVVIKER